MLRKRFIHPAFWLFCFQLLAGNVWAFKSNDAPPSDVDTNVVKKILEAADSYLKTGEANKAFFEVEHALALVRKSSNKTLIFNVLRHGGLLAEEFNQLSDAAHYYEEALVLSKSLTHSQQLDIYLDWAIVNKKLGKYSVSKEYYTKSLELAERLGQNDMVSFSFNGLATLHSALSDFEKSIEYYQKAIEVAEKIKDTEGVLIYYRNLARLYIKANNYDLAFKNAKLAYDIAINLKDSTDIAVCLATIGKSLTPQNKLEEALSYHLKALTYIESVRNKQSTIEVLLNIADTYAQMNRLDEAEKYYQKGLAFESYLSGYSLPEFFYKLGNLYVKTGERDKALTAFNKSLSHSESNNYKDLIQKNNAALAQIFEENGNVNKAFFYLKTAQRYTDSLFNEEKNRHITEAQFKFDVARSERQFKDFQVQQSRYMLIFSVIMLTVILGSVLYFYRQRGKNLEAMKMKSVEIQLQNRRLEESNEILQQFAYASAHDLKEPLRSISSFTSIIGRRYLPLLPPEASDYMNFVTAGVKRMEKLLSALLEYSTVAAENQIVTQAMPLVKVLDDVCKNLNATISDKEAIVDYDAKLPELYVSRLHLTQLFQNLIGNALKFTVDRPKVKISSKSATDHVIIVVKDNGIGMKKDHSDKIFRLFQRLDRDPRYEGTGIGLTICKNIVEKYDGKIWCESEEGVGTTFYIQLPISVAHQEVFTEGVGKRELVKI